jgi:hypothetical protein
MNSLRVALPAVSILGLCMGPFAHAAPVLCNGSDKTMAEAARYTARAQIDLAIKALDKDDSKAKAAMVRWFGKDDAAAIDTVKGVLSRSSGWTNAVKFYCLYSNDGKHLEAEKPSAPAIIIDYSGGVYAYVDITDQSKVYLGLAFFKAPESGPDSKFGTILHELTHFWLTGNTEDFKIYGKDKTLKLARSDPPAALKHADSYQYLVEELAR